MSFALANGMVAENAFLDWDFYVYELIEETVDIFNITIVHTIFFYAKEALFEPLLRILPLLTACPRTS